MRCIGLLVAVGVLLCVLAPAVKADTLEATARLVTDAPKYTYYCPYGGTTTVNMTSTYYLNFTQNLTSGIDVSYQMTWLERISLFTYQNAAQDSDNNITITIPANTGFWERRTSLSGSENPSAGHYNPVSTASFSVGAQGPTYGYDGHALDVYATM